MDKVTIFAIAGKAGAGKDSLINNVIQEQHNVFHKIVSCTTRPKRDYEVNGKDYHFLTTEEFDNAIEAGDMMEWCVFNNWKYGTRFSDLHNGFDKINIGTFNPTGISSLKKFSKDLIKTTVFYVAAGDKQRLMRQLEREDKPNVQEIIRRFGTDTIDFSGFDYDILLMNDTMGQFKQSASILNLQARWAKEIN